MIRLNVKKQEIDGIKVDLELYINPDSIVCIERKGNDMNRIILSNNSSYHISDDQLNKLLNNTINIY